MIELPLSTILLLALAALFAGAVDAIGGGGGLVTVPALLAAGLPPHLALATNKGQGVFGSGASLARYARAGMIDGRRARFEFAAGLVGALAGAALLLRVPPDVLRPVVLVLLVLAATVLVLRSPSPSTDERRPPRALWVAVAIALVLGVYDGFFGPGMGTLLILAYVWLFGERLQQASADAKVVNFASNIAAVALFSARGTIVWSVALPMAVGQFTGAVIGAQLVVHGGDRVVRPVALLVVAALIAKLTLDLLR
jgi:uncharacterized protein